MAGGAILLSNEVPFLWAWLPAKIIAARCRSHKKEEFQPLCELGASAVKTDFGRPD